MNGWKRHWEVGFSKNLTTGCIFKLLHWCGELPIGLCISNPANSPILVGMRYGLYKVSNYEPYCYLKGRKLLEKIH